MELTRCNLNKRAVQTRVSQAKAYYERLHISPLMVSICFREKFEYFLDSFELLARPLTEKGWSGSWDPMGIFEFDVRKCWRNAH